jgi:hypothetical protein
VLKVASEKTGMYGMWSVKQKRFIFGIQETSKNKARKALEKEIGYFNPWFFRPKAIFEGHADMLGNGLGKELKRGAHIKI